LTTVALKILLRSSLLADSASSLFLKVITSLVLTNELLQEADAV